MFAVYATHADADNPLAALKIGERPEPSAPDGWTRVKISHASLNRHDLFTLRGITAHPEGIAYPMMLGNDAGELDIINENPGVSRGYVAACHQAAFVDKVEAPGIEPGSRRTSASASTCVA